MTSAHVYLFLDLTNAGNEPEEISDYLRFTMSADGLGNFVEGATVLLPANHDLSELAPARGWHIAAGGRPILEANAAMQSAGDSGCHLLVLLGPAAATSEAVGVLIEAFALDSHFGVNIPRQLDADGTVHKIAQEQGDPALKTLARRMLTGIPEYYILPEMLASCMLIRDTLVANLPALDESYETLRGSIAHYLSRARRAGFRTAVINHAAISADADANRSPLVSKADMRKLHTEYPDAGRAKTELIEQPLHAFESFLGRLYSLKADLRKSLLLDVRGVPSHINGTAEAVLALCDALKRESAGWQISLLALPASAQYHQLESRYPEWPILTHEENHHFTAALRPSQPWHMSTMLELHRMALLNFYMMLDTISWDILFEAPAGLHAYWDFMSQYADGLLYDSFDTRDHVVRRFPDAASRPEHVSQLSFHPRDYALESFLDLANPGEYIFVIGNDYDHKNLGPTVDLLTSAFPFQNLKVLGLKRHSHPRVQVLESGRVPVEDIEALFARAKLIVFPSFYEGFGFPVMKGLSYGRTVIARKSSLLRELADNYRGPGRLLGFTTPADFVDTVGRMIHGYPVEEVPLGGALSDGQEPKDWRVIARGILQFVENRMESPADIQWMKRERAIRQLNAFSF